MCRGQVGLPLQNLGSEPPALGVEDEAALLSSKYSIGQGAHGFLNVNKRFLCGLPHA